MFDQPPQRKLHRNMRIVWVFAALVVTAILTGVAALPVVLFAVANDRDPAWWVPTTVFVICLLASVPWVLAAWRRWRWDVTDIALTLHRGVFLHRSVALPFFRIQHIDTNRGPLDQMLGMTTLRVSTASTAARLPGIAADEATAVRQELLARAQRAAEAVGGQGSIDAV